MGATGFLAQFAGGTRGTAKYARVGFWGRGDYGLHRTDDPRIFKPPIRRKYPYFKQRSWSKPYICKSFSMAALEGSALRLAISYVPFEGAEVYYQLRRALESALPGAQIIGDGDVASEEQQKPENRKAQEIGLQVLTLNDGRTLLSLQKGKEADALQQDTFAELLRNAMDNLDWRLGAAA